MTSAPSHRRLLNGNKLLVFLSLICIFIAYSCGSSKVTNDRSRSTSSRPSRPITKAPTKKPVAKVDTVQWDIADEAVVVPIGSAAGVPTEKKNSYNVTILIPFEAKNYKMSNVSDAKSGLRFANYYAGVLKGLEELDQAGIRLNINVLDSKDMNIRAKLNMITTKNADVIIGPYDRDQLKEVIKFGEDNEIVVVSPWQAISDPSEANPNYIQLRPDLDDYYVKMLKEAHRKFNDDEIRILVREGDSRDAKRVEYLEKLAKEYGIIQSSERFQILELNEDSLMMGESAYDSIFYSMDKSAYLLPNWSSKDENFIYSSLRRMSVEKGMSKVSVFGMEILLDSDKMDFEFFKNLDIHVVRWKYVDEQSYSVKSFKKAFFATYNSLPTIDAYDGYDMINYVGRNLAAHGKFFQYKDNTYNDYLQTDFEIQAVSKDPTEFGDNSKINYFANKHLDIVRFDGRYFSKK